MLLQPVRLFWLSLVNLASDHTSQLFTFCKQLGTGTVAEFAELQTNSPPDGTVRTCQVGTTATSHADQLQGIKD